jgi:hypothetical protein
VKPTSLWANAILYPVGPIRRGLVRARGAMLSIDAARDEW